MNDEKEKNMIKNIIFDLGNVLLDFNPLGYLKTRLASETKIHEVHKEIFLSDEWLMLDRGAITEEEAINILCKKSVNNSKLIRECMENWYSMLTPIEGTVEILNEVKEKGYRVFVLSNFHLLAYKEVVKNYTFFSKFDGGIISYNENIIKPSAEIFHKLIEKYNVKPEESIFIDDTKVNIEAAERLGFETILFKCPEQLQVELNKII